MLLRIAGRLRISAERKAMSGPRQAGMPILRDGMRLRTAGRNNAVAAVYYTVPRDPRFNPKPATNEVLKYRIFRHLLFAPAIEINVRFKIYFSCYSDTTGAGATTYRWSVFLTGIGSACFRDIALSLLSLL